jgi:leucine-zipper of insertion element IS481
LDGAVISAVARQYGVSRQTVYAWLRRYARDGAVLNLEDRSSRPHGCPHHMAPTLEARVLVLRDANPRWVRPVLSMSWLVRVWSQCRVVPVCIGRWCATGVSTRGDAVGGAATASAGSGAGRRSCGRWMWSAGPILPIAETTATMSAQGVWGRSSTTNFGRRRLTPTRYVEVRRRFLREHPGHALDGWPLPAD